MRKVYESALRKARELVFENDKYEKIISFCKYKLDPCVYTRREVDYVFPNGSVSETKVFIDTVKSETFKEYVAMKRNNVSVRKEIF